MRRLFPRNSQFCRQNLKRRHLRVKPQALPGEILEERPSDPVVKRIAGSQNKRTPSLQTFRKRTGIAQSCSVQFDFPRGAFAKERKNAASSGDHFRLRGKRPHFRTQSRSGHSRDINPWFLLHKSLSPESW